MSKHLSKKRVIPVLILLVLDGLFFGFTNPNSINSVYLIVGIILVGITFFGFLDLMLYILTRSGLNLRHRKKLALYLTAMFVVLLALQTIGQLTFRDVIVIVPLVSLLYIYLTYVRSGSDKQA
jgi:hypothetical protein